MTLLVQGLLENAAARWPHKTALICGERHYSYRDLDGQANRLANGFISLGVRRGDRVALMLGNTVEMIVAIFAVLKADAVFVPIHENTKPHRIDQILASAQPVAMVSRQASVISDQSSVISHQSSVVSLSDEAGNPKADGQKGEGGFFPEVFILVGPEAVSSSDERSRTELWETILLEQPCTRPPQSTIDLDLACLIYTSGTTGAPKGVMCGHNNMVFAIGAIADYLENRAEDRILSVLSLAYSYGLYQMLVTFQTGATLILEQSFAYPILVLQKMAEQRVTGFAGTPTIYALLLRFDLAPFDLSALRYLTNAAAGLPVEHVRRVRAAFPRARFYSMHGLTEVVRTLYLPPELVDQKPASVGIPMPGTEAWIMDDAGERAGPGTVGELVIRGRHVMRGYWRDAEATARRFRPGAIPGEQICHTGDLFKTDADDHFHFVSRSDDIIKCGGEKVAPREVEDVLCQIRGVVEAAVVGVPDPILGEVIKAFLVVDGHLVTREDVFRHCRLELEEHMRPRHLEFRSELPKNQSGKVMRAELV